MEQNYSITQVKYVLIAALSIIIIGTKRKYTNVFYQIIKYQKNRFNKLNRKKR